jgi:hypothetical protein
MPLQNDDQVFKIHVFEAPKILRETVEPYAHAILATNLRHEGRHDQTDYDYARFKIRRPDRVLPS